MNRVPTVEARGPAGPQRHGDTNRFRKVLHM